MKLKSALKTRCLLGTGLSTLILNALLTGCSLWHDDLPECPSGADVEFVYDYNVQRADMFNAHVGSVTVHVFDAAGHHVMSREECNRPGDTPLRDHGYRMHLDLPPGEYKLIAHAHQRGTQELANRPGAKFRHTAMRQGDAMESLKSTLDRNATGEVEHREVSLDTLWHGMTATNLVVRDMQPASARISLVRNTNDIHITLRQLDSPADIHASDFEATITDRNGTLGHDNSVLPDDEITYTPWATWTSEFPSDDDTSDSPVKRGETEVEQRTAHLQFSVSRLIWRPANESPAMLTIRNRNTGAIVAKINLPDCLAMGRNAFETQNYSRQEFLDREYNYRLDFFLRGDKWVYAYLGISILGWDYRFQPVDF